MIFEGMGLHVFFRYQNIQIRLGTSFLVALIGAFYSADYNENEEGFRYSADIQYKLDADMWLGEIKANQIYDTGVEVEFGDEFITLTTCDHSRRHNGRFVVVARRIREGEKIQ